MKKYLFLVFLISFSGCAQWEAAISQINVAVEAADRRVFFPVLDAFKTFMPDNLIGMLVDGFQGDWQGLRRRVVILETFGINERENAEVIKALQDEARGSGEEFLSAEFSAEENASLLRMQLAALEGHVDLLFHDVVLLPQQFEEQKKLLKELGEDERAESLVQEPLDLKTQEGRRDKVIAESIKLNAALAQAVFINGSLLDLELEAAIQETLEAIKKGGAKFQRALRAMEKK